VGFWSEDNANSNLSAITFMDDGTYVQVQVNNSSSVNDSDGGLEWGEYSIDSKTGKLTTTQLFDENGTMGLSDDLNYFARVSNGKLIIEVDENENGSIDSNEQFKFSEIKPNGIVGSWGFDNAYEDELIGVAFLDDDQYVHVQVDSDHSVDNSENGLEWGTYVINPSTSQLTTSQTFDSNGGKGLSEPSTRYARVTDDEKLIIDVDDESFTFSRTMTNSMINPQML
ncbi:hypothetical protein, partial [Psychrobacter sp. 1Y4]|uniref:hypothetical protein n=1 Tax=Psychrobacter sp. 1Y4 TaxID=3453575 RepID=UPI003F48BB89